MAALALIAFAAAPVSAKGQIVEHLIKPSLADPNVRQFDEPSIALIDPTLPPDAPLVIFMPGTGGKPANTLPMLEVIARQGYRALGLEYNDAPPGTEFCPRDPDPDCLAAFREMRVSGKGTSRWFKNAPAEAIERRLVATLKALDAAAPSENWGSYLDGDQPRWARIIVSGASMGAGMATYIAKQHLVRRVVLFSSPWDTTGRDQHPAPWLFRPSATPPERWQAEYNKRENTAASLKAAYAASAIPAANIHIFDLDLPPGLKPTWANPYHSLTVTDVRYAPQWRVMFGAGTDPQP